MSTIKVSRSTLEELEALREAWKAKSVEEVIRRFLKREKAENTRRDFRAR